MIGVLTDFRAGLAGMPELGPDVLSGLLAQDARLLGFIRACAFGRDDGQALGP